MKPSETIPEFDRFLEEKGRRLEAVILGGTALDLLGVISRETRDCDVLVPPLDEPILGAAKEFAARQRAAGVDLRDDWLNNGPASLTKWLPQGWESRLQPAFSGRALLLRSLGRADLLKTKLYAYCDRQTDLLDCLALHPSQKELAESLPWVQYQDANPQWPAYVAEVFADLSRRLGHGI